MSVKTATKSAKVVAAVKVTQVTPEAKVLPTSMTAAIVRLNNAKAMIKAFTADKDAADAEIRAALGTAEIGIIDGVERIVLAHRSTTNINGKALLEAFPEAYTATAYTTSYTVIQTK